MKKFLRSTTMTAIMFLLAVGLLAVGAIGGTQAALNIRSNNYYSAFDLDHIGVALLDNGNLVAQRTFTDAVSENPDEAVIVALDGKLTPNLGEDKEVKIGKQYALPITVQNTGTIDQYVRVTLRKYWVTDAELDPEDPRSSMGWFHGDGTKIINDVYLPQYIQLGYNGVSNSYNSSSWILDDGPTGASTAERAVYYYKGILEPGAVSAELINNIAISTDVTQNAVVTVEKVGNVTKTIYTYAYDGIGFVIRAEVDAIQTHHARAAMTSAWGTSSAVMTAMGVPEEA